MNYQTLGTSTIEISSVIMGTWQAGKAMWTGIDDTQTTRAIHRALDAGITTFDTAPVYGSGHSERILGKALAPVRQKVVIATKVFANKLHRDGVIASCHRSLKDLNTDTIDLLQIHWPAGSFGSRPVPIEETMNAMDTLKQEGKIRAIGVSNFSASQLAAAARYGRIESLQPPYSLFWRHAEADAIPFCRQHGISVLAYSPMAQGLLTGKFGPDHRFAKGDHRAENRLFGPEHTPRVQAALDRLRPIARDHGVSLARLALAWVLSHPATAAVAGARSAEQVADNAAAAEVMLSPAELDLMERIGRGVTDHLDDNPIMWTF